MSGTLFECVVLASKLSATTTMPIKTSSPENNQHRKKRRRRRRIITEEEAELPLYASTELENVEPEMTMQDGGNENESKTKRKKRIRRRRKGSDVALTKDNEALPTLLPRNDTNTLESNHTHVEITDEDSESNSQARVDDGDERNNATTTCAVGNTTEFAKDEKEDNNPIQIDNLTPQSHSNDTIIPLNVTSKESTNNKVKATTNESQPIRKMKKQQKKKAKNVPNKPATTSSFSGKEGECLRRIKHEWKDAVRSGIAYDWINMKTIRNTNTTSSNYVRIGPFGKNLLRWHFSVRGPANSVYENGIYHGRVLLPKDYPASPPRVQMITPSGRFVPGEDICLSASSYHPESWTPRWTVLSLVDGLRLHMLTTANEIGGVLASDEKRRQYADESRSWKYHGIANHERMVAENIFAAHDLDSGESDDNDCEPNDATKMPIASVAAVTNYDCKGEKIEHNTSEQNATNNSLPKIEEKKATPKKKKSKTQHKSNVSKVKEDNTVLTEQAPVPTSHVEKAPQKDVSISKSVKAKAKKRKKSSASPSASESNNKSRGNTTSTATKKKDTRKKTEVQSTKSVQVRRKERSILHTMLKRLVVDLLKLFLRVFAILIQILDRLEKFLRAVLDSV